MKIIVNNYFYENYYQIKSWFFNFLIVEKRKCLTYGIVVSIIITA